MRKLILSAALVAVAAAQTFPVAGVVTDAIRGAPLERAHVILGSGSDRPLTLVTTADGKFSFDVPQGKYNLYAERNGWRMQYGTFGSSVGFGSAIITGPGQDTAHLSLQWYAPAAISGAVTDEQGEPVRDATVQLMCDSAEGGWKRVVQAGTAATDDRGEYRFAPLAAGKYYIVVTGQPWYATRAPRAPSDLSVGYPPTYFPGTTDARTAVPITLKAGTEAHADVAIRATAGVSLRIRCPGIGAQDDICQGITSLYLPGIGGQEVIQPTGNNWATHSLSGVLPGRYTVRFAGQELSASRVIDVGSDDLTIDLTMQQPTLITGTVTFKNGLPKRGSTLNIGMMDPTTGDAVGFPVEPDGTFRIANANAAPFRPFLYGSAAQFIAQMSVEGAPFKDGVVDLTENTAVNLKIVASDETGRVKGFAMNGDTPAPAVMVVLAPRTESHDPTNYRGFQTESDGSFDYVNIPAGDYLLFAVDRLDLEYTNPDVVRPYLSSAMAVHLPAHGVVEQRVPLSATPKE
jgi:hypothetical protein